MCKQLKSSLTRPAQGKLMGLIRHLNNGYSYVQLHGKKLNTRGELGLSISFRLSRRERAIFCRKYDGSFELQFAGTHARYNRLVSSN